MSRGWILCLTLLAQGLWADEKSKADKIDQMMKLMNVDSAMRSYMDSTLEQLNAKSIAKMTGLPISPELETALQGVEAKVSKMLKETMDWEKLKPRFSQIYAEAYTEEELDAILVFYRSPAGQAVIAKMPLIMKKSTQLSQEMFIQMQPKIQQLIMSTMQELVTPKQP